MMTRVCFFILAIIGTLAILGIYVDQFGLWR